MECVLTFLYRDPNLWTVKCKVWAQFLFSFLDTSSDLIALENVNVESCPVLDWRGEGHCHCFDEEVHRLSVYGHGECVAEPMILALTLVLTHGSVCLAVNFDAFDCLSYAAPSNQVSGFS